MRSLIEIAEEYATEAHEKTNHRYDEEGKNLPYTFHLRSVFDYAILYKHLIPEDVRETVLAACWCHDTIEDARQTYNDVRSKLGVVVADIVYAVTNEKGRNRAERANDKYYEGIRNTPYANFVKICDRLAGVSYDSGRSTNLLDCYRFEHIKFRSELYQPEYREMFEELSRLLSK